MSSIPRFCVQPWRASCRMHWLPSEPLLHVPRKEVEILQTLNNADKANKRHIVQLIETWHCLGTQKNPLVQLHVPICTWFFKDSLVPRVGPCKLMGHHKISVGKGMRESVLMLLLFFLVFQGHFLLPCPALACNTSRRQI